MKFKTGQQVIFARQSHHPYHQINQPIGSLAEVLNPPYSGVEDCYLNVKWLDTTYGQMAGGYYKESFDAAEPTDQELADKWRELALEARNIRRQLQAKGFSFQIKPNSSSSYWNDTPKLGAEVVEYRFYKEDVVKTETIL